MRLKGSLILIALLTAVLSSPPSRAQGMGNPPASTAGTFEVDNEPPPDVVHGPVAVPLNIEIVNEGPAKVTLYVVDRGAEELPADWELGEELPEGWTLAATLDDGESSIVGPGEGDRIMAHSHDAGGSDLVYTPL